MRYKLSPKLNRREIQMVLIEDNHLVVKELSNLPLSNENETIDSTVNVNAAIACLNQSQCNFNQLIRDDRVTDFAKLSRWRGPRLMSLHSSRISASIHTHQQIMTLKNRKKHA